MGKKKKGKKGGKKGKKGKAKPTKDGIPALEKATLLLKIEELQGKVLRKSQMISFNQQVLEGYRSLYENEKLDKDSIYQSLKNAAIELRGFNEQYQESIVLTENRQEQEILELEEELSSLKTQKSDLQESLGKEISELRQKYYDLERFRSDMPEVRRRTEQAIMKSSRQKIKFQVEVSLATRHARGTIEQLKNQMMEFAEDKSVAFKQNFVKTVNPAYLKPIQEAVVLEERVAQLSTTVEQIDEENNVLEQSVKELSERYNRRVEDTRTRTIELESHRQLGCLLKTKCHQLDKEFETLVQQRIKKEESQAQVKQLKLDLLNVLDEIERHSGDLVESEKALLQIVETQSIEEDLNRKLTSVIKQAVSFIKDDVILCLKDSRYRMECEDLLLRVVNLFSEAIRDTEDDMQMIYDVDKRKEAGGLDVAYKMGYEGILPTLDRVQDSTSRKDTAVQTENFKALNLTSAKILSEMGLMRKFEKKSKNVYAMRSAQ